jgi:hypothetical protein
VRRHGRIVVVGGGLVCEVDWLRVSRQVVEHRRSVWSTETRPGTPQRLDGHLGYSCHVVGPVGI